MSGLQVQILMILEWKIRLLLPSKPFKNIVNSIVLHSIIEIIYDEFGGGVHTHLLISWILGGPFWEHFGGPGEPLWHQFGGHLVQGCAQEGP